VKLSEWARNRGISDTPDMTAALHKHGQQKGGMMMMMMMMKQQMWWHAIRGYHRHPIPNSAQLLFRLRLRGCVRPEDPTDHEPLHDCDEYTDPVGETPWAPKAKQDELKRQRRRENHSPLHISSIPRGHSRGMPELTPSGDQRQNGPRPKQQRANPGE
jgi:hypothetical protein